jgi:hypothetical protein
LKQGFGFRSGAAPRVGIALGWAVVAFGVVFVLNNRDANRPTPSTPVRTQSAPSIRGDQVELQLAAGFRVERWVVMVGGEEVVADQSDSGKWMARIDQPSSTNHFEIFVEAQVADHFAEHRQALMVSLSRGGRRAERTIWSDGDINTLIDVDQFLGD